MNKYILFIDSRIIYARNELDVLNKFLALTPSKQERVRAYKLHKEIDMFMAFNLTRGTK